MPNCLMASIRLMIRDPKPIMVVKPQITERFRKHYIIRIRKSK